MESKELKKLVVYYSLEGNTKFIAKAISEEIGADILELKPKKPIKSHGFMKYVIGGKQASFRQKPDLLKYDVNPQDYDIIFFGTPVWAGKCTPAFNTFFSNTELNGKNVALFCCYSGQKGKIFDQFKEYLKGNSIVGEIEFKDPLKHDKSENESRVKKWAKERVENIK